MEEEEPLTYREWKQSYILAMDHSYTVKKYKRWLRKRKRLDRKQKELLD